MTVHVEHVYALSGHAGAAYLDGKPVVPFCGGLDNRHPAFTEGLAGVGPLDTRAPCDACKLIEATAIAPAAATATGLMSKHLAQLKAFLDEAFG